MYYVIIKKEKNSIISFLKDCIQQWKNWVPPGLQIFNDESLLKAPIIKNHPSNFRDNNHFIIYDK